MRHEKMPKGSPTTPRASFLYIYLHNLVLQLYYKVEHLSVIAVIQ